APCPELHRRCNPCGRAEIRIQRRHRKDHRGEAMTKEAHITRSPTWASLAVMGGMPLMVVARQLGHADTRMVERHYGHMAPDYINEAIRAGSQKFGIEPD